MLQMALRQAVELGSFVRAARNFSELTGVPISDSSLQRLVVETGTTVVQADAQEAEAMVRVAKEEEGVTYRIPEPDSEVMALSADGVMVHLREEGWKEARVASVSAVPVCVEGELTKGEPRLEKHSYRAGLLPKPLPTTTGLRVTAAGWKRQNRLHQRWRHLDLDDGLRLFFPPHRNPRLGTCCSTSGRSQSSDGVPHRKPPPGLKLRKPP